MEKNNNKQLITKDSTASLSETDYFIAKEVLENIFGITPTEKNMDLTIRHLQHLEKAVMAVNPMEN